MNQLIHMLEAATGKHITLALALKLAPILAPIVADLADGDPHLSAANRLKVDALVLDIKAGRFQ